MSLSKEKMPIYDDRVNEVITSLRAGMTREELSAKYKHGDYRSLDMYMRRRNFVWDSEEKNYKPSTSRIKKSALLSETTHSGKVSRIINAFKERRDPKTVAVEYGFSDHRELAAYMTQKGYEWDREEGNYARKAGVEHNEENQDTDPIKSSENQPIKNGAEVIQLLQLIKEKLNLSTDPIVDEVPRYLITGIAKTKSVQMSHLLHQLIEDFSYDRNITHRQIFEIAIIDFLRKHGYRNEVDMLLGK